ncbi:hypothetical protein PGB90_003733 [Kerria lacca]
MNSNSKLVYPCRVEGWLNVVGDLEYKKIVDKHNIACHGFFYDTIDLNITFRVLYYRFYYIAYRKIIIVSISVELIKL